MKIKQFATLCLVFVFLLSSFAFLGTAAPTIETDAILTLDIPINLEGELPNGSPVTGYLSGSGDTEMWYIDVGAGATSMRSVLTFDAGWGWWGDDFDLYGRLGAEPTTNSYDWRGYTNGEEDVTYDDPGEGRWYIMVRSYRGSGDYELTVTVEGGGGGGDTTPPSVSITNPDNGDTVSDTVTIQASASDNVGVSYVQCRIDSGTWTSDSSSPYSWSWDTTGSSDGTHTITCRAYDAAGNYDDDSITVTVDNDGGGGGGDNELTNGVTVTSSLAAQYDTEMWYIVVDDDAETMNTVLTCGSSDFDVYGRLGAEPTTSNYDWRGYTSGGEDVDYDSPGAGTWYIMVRSYSGTGSYDLTVTIDYDGGGGGGGDGEKIAVFFSASDAYTPASYFTGTLTDILEDEGYTKFFYFRDSSNPQADMQEVDDYEDADDTVFIYILGHGNNDGSHSYTAFSPSSSIVYSDDFRDWYDDFEAERKCLFVESCHSGDWADDFRASPYLAMSTSDEDSYSYVGTFGGIQMGYYTYYFFQAISNGYNGVDAYNYAKSMDNYNQGGKIYDYSDYVWFSD
jgi:hypothetical protein